MKKSKIWLIPALVLVFGLVVSGCATMETKQFGEAGDKTIALNLTDSGIGKIYVTHVDGTATGAQIGHTFFLFFGTKDVYINPVYMKLTGKPILITIACPVSSNGGKTVYYKSCELRLTKLSDFKGGEVLTLKYMYITNTFMFLDADGNIIQQIIPTFKPLV